MLSKQFSFFLKKKKLISKYQKYIVCERNCISDFKNYKWEIYRSEIENVSKNI